MSNYVTSFEEACARKGISTELPDVSSFPEHLRNHLLATYKLSVILDINNGDWKPDLGDTNQYKYYPWFRIVKKSPSGFGLSYFGCGFDSTASLLGVRLACKDSDLAEFMGTTFPDLYKDLHS